MNKITFIVFAICYFIIPGKINTQCIASEKFPASNITAPAFQGNYIITNSQFAGQYYIVQDLEIGKIYQFNSNQNGDYITIRSAYNFSEIKVHGLSPLSYTVTGDDIISVHIHKSNPVCGIDNISRTSSINCITCPTSPPAVGIDKAIPQSTLDVNGSLKLGDSNHVPVAGMMRWNSLSQDFEGYNGIEWLSLTRAKANWGLVPDNKSLENAKIFAADGGSFKQFGLSVSISDDYAIVRSNTDGTQSQGSAYIFKKDNNTWIQEAKIVASDAGANDYFGYSVSISGDYAVIGARGDKINTNNSQGSAYVFRRSGNNWIQEAKLIASDGGAFDQFGHSVSIYNDLIVVSAFTDDISSNTDQGSAYIFKRTGITWNQESKIMASDGSADDNFGISVSINGNYVIIGSYLDDIASNIDQGSAYIFKRNGTNWLQEAKIIGTNGFTSDLFGCSVSIYGDYAIVGSYLDDYNNSNNQGSAYIFKRDGTIWSQESMLLPSVPNNSINFGVSVAMYGEYAAIGANNEMIDGSIKGSAYVFKRSGNNWSQESFLTASEGKQYDNFGINVAMSNYHLIVGSNEDDFPNNPDQGSAYIFHK